MGDEDGAFRYESLLWFTALAWVNRKITGAASVRAADGVSRAPAKRYYPESAAEAPSLDRAERLAGLYKPLRWRSVPLPERGEDEEEQTDDDLPMNQDLMEPSDEQVRDLTVNASVRDLAMGGNGRADSPVRPDEGDDDDDDSEDLLETTEVVQPVRSVRRRQQPQPQQQPPELEEEEDEETPVLEADGPFQPPRVEDIDDRLYDEEDLGPMTALGAPTPFSGSSVLPVPKTPAISNESRQRERDERYMRDNPTLFANPAAVDLYLPAPDSDSDDDETQIEEFSQDLMGDTATLEAMRREMRPPSPAMSEIQTIVGEGDDDELTRMRRDLGAMSPAVSEIQTIVGDPRAVTDRELDEMRRPLSPALSEIQSIVGEPGALVDYTRPFTQPRTKKKAPAPPPKNPTGVLFEDEDDDDDDVMVVGEVSAAAAAAARPSTSASASTSTSAPRSSASAAGGSRGRKRPSTEAMLDDLGEVRELSEGEYRRETNRAERERVLTERLGTKKFVVDKSGGGGRRAGSDKPGDAGLPRVQLLGPARPKSAAPAAATSMTGAQDRGPWIFTFPEEVTAGGRADLAALERATLQSALGLRIRASNAFAVKGSPRTNLSSAEALSAARALARGQAGDRCLSCPNNKQEHSVFTHVAQKVEMEWDSYEPLVRPLARRLLENKDVWLVDGKFVATAKRAPIVWPVVTTETFFSVARGKTHADDAYVCPRCPPLAGPRDVADKTFEYTQREALQRVAESKLSQNETAVIMQRADLVKHLRGLHTDDFVGALTQQVLPFSVLSNFTFAWTPAEALRYALAVATGVFFSRGKPYPRVRASASEPLSAVETRGLVEYVEAVTAYVRKKAKRLPAVVTSDVRFYNETEIAWQPGFNLRSPDSFVKPAAAAAAAALRGVGSSLASKALSSGSSGGFIRPAPPVQPSATLGGRRSNVEGLETGRSVVPAEFRLGRIAVPDREKLLKYTVLGEPIASARPVPLDRLLSAKYASLENNSATALKGRMRALTGVDQAKILVLELCVRRSVSGANLFGPLFQIAVFREQTTRGAAVVSGIIPVYLYDRGLALTRSKLTAFVRELERTGRSVFSSRESKALTPAEQYRLRIEVVLRNLAELKNTVNTCLYLRRIPKWTLDHVWVDSELKLSVELSEPMMVHKSTAELAVQSVSALTGFLLDVNPERELLPWQTMALREQPRALGLSVYLNQVATSGTVPDGWSVDRVALSGRNPLAVTLDGREPLLNVYVADTVKARPMPLDYFTRLVAA